MSKQHRIVRSDDATTVIIAGDKRNPEPTMAAIVFPGGCLEVSRTSDGTYWAHISVNGDKQVTDEAGKFHERRGRIIDSRVDFVFPQQTKLGIPEIPNAKDAQHVAVRIETFKPE